MVKTQEWNNGFKQESNTENKKNCWYFNNTINLRGFDPNAIETTEKQGLHHFYAPVQPAYWDKKIVFSIIQ